MDGAIPGRVPREGTLRQATLMPYRAQSFSSNVIYVERRLSVCRLFALIFLT